MGNDAGPGGGREDTGIEIDQAAQRGDAELASLQDDVCGVEVERHLRAVRRKGTRVPVLSVIV